MIKYVFTRIILILISIFIIITFMYFSLNYTNFSRIYDIPFNDFMNISLRLYKIFIRETVIGGDWGLTIDGELIAEVIVPRFWITIKYNLLALLIYVPVGVIIGTLTAIHKGSFFDRVVSGFVLIVGSLPIYLLLAYYIFIFSIRLHILPYHEVFIQDGFFGEILGYGIPLMVLSTHATFRVSRVIRTELIEMINSDHYALCRAKGLKKSQIFRRHLLRSAFIPLMPELVDIFIVILAGSFFVELTCGIHGVAELFYDSLIRAIPGWDAFFIAIDVNTTIIITTYYLTLGMVLSLVADIGLHLLDPRIKLNK